MAEWSNAPDSKSGSRLCRDVGSNPTLSTTTLWYIPGHRVGLSQPRALGRLRQLPTTCRPAAAHFDLYAPGLQPLAVAATLWVSGGRWSQQGVDRAAKCSPQALRYKHSAKSLSVWLEGEGFGGRGAGASSTVASDPAIAR